jgi:uncharacterized protein YukE
MTSKGFDISPNDLMNLESSFASAATELADLAGGVTSAIDDADPHWGGDSNGRQIAQAYAQSGVAMAAGLQMLSQIMQSFANALHDMALTYHIADQNAEQSAIGLCQGL